MSVKVTNLDDFISPGLECIKPAQVETTTLPEGAPKKQIGYRNDAAKSLNRTETESQYALKVAKVSLKDCLACSGCITSAEAVLVERQTHQELLRIIDEFANGNAEFNHVVVSLSPQSRIAIASHYGTTQERVLRRISSYCRKKLRATEIWDTSMANDISLLQSSAEFMNRVKMNSPSHPVLPMMASSCPGWICYAEKMKHELLPLVSTAKSAQQITGIFLKQRFGPKNVFHVTVMPCYDKKLEAMREEVAGEVDMVITTTELLELMNGWTAEENVDMSKFRTDPSGQLSRNAGSASGGYLDHITSHCVPLLLSQEYDIRSRIIRSEDFTEVTIHVSGEEVPKLRLAYVYGFRNIQNLMRNMKKTSQSKGYDYIEVMACPKGCLNGGGQLDRKLPPKERKEWISKMDALFNSMPQSRVSVIEQLGTHQDLSRWYANLLADWDKSRDGLPDPLHTSYNAVPQDDFSLGVVW